MINFDLIFDILGIAIFSNIFATAIPPLEHLKDKYKIRPEDHSFSSLIYYPIYLINCPSCLSFWSTLLLTFSPSFAFISYFLALLFSRVFNAPIKL